MELKNQKQMSETHLLGLLLALIGGFLDAYTFLCRGKVFANAQTGNLVLLGVQLVDRDWTRAFYYLMPVLAFVAGIFICEMIQSRFKWENRIHWRQMIVLIEALCLLTAGFLPLETCDTIVNVMVSFVCALQVEAFRKMNGNSYATTMCTGNLRSATENLYRYLKDGERRKLISSLQYYNVILFFIAGAAIGGILSAHFGQNAVWVCVIGLLAVFGAMFKKQ